MRYGTKIKLVCDHSGYENAAYKRIKKGLFPTYYVLGSNWGSNRISAALIDKNGNISSASYSFALSEVIPEAIFEKQLEDYL